MDGDRGWTADKIDGFYNEVRNVLEVAKNVKEVPTEEEFNKNIAKLNVSESYKVEIGNAEIEILCEDMPEEEFNNLNEFSGW